MLKAILFDADNTLYKIKKSRATEGMLSFLEKETGIKKGRLRDVLENVKNEVKASSDPEMRKREYAVKIALYRLEYDSKDSENLSRKSADIFNSIVAKDLEFEKDNRKILRGLKKKYRLAIASDEFEDFLKMKLNKALVDYRKYFSFLITPEKARTMKPSPVYYEIALKRLGLKPSEVAMIGDSWARDIEPAARMGMKTILVSSRIEGKPNHWVKSLRELSKIL